MAPSLSQLTNRHKIHKQFHEHWEILAAMVAGGSDMTEEVRKKLLANPDKCEKDVYAERVRMAPYDAVVGAIVMRLTSQLLADKASYEGSSDDFWEDEFFERSILLPDDEDSQATFHQGLTVAAMGALTCGKHIAQIDVRESMALNRYQQRMMGGDKPYVVMRARGDLWDWEGDRDGFRFVKLHDYYEERESWDSKPIQIHQFTVYQRDSGGTIYGGIFRVRLTAEAAKTIDNFTNRRLCDLSDNDVEIEEYKPLNPIFSTRDNRFLFPVVCLSFPSQLCIADQVFDLQKSYYNHVAGGEWAQLQTNYAQLVFTGVDKPHEQGNNNPSRDMPVGDGRYWELGDGQDAKWLVRDPEGIQLSIDYQEKLKSRMLEAIAAIAETAAATYATRYQSGDSKKEQRRNLDILLEVYGEKIRGFAASILNVAAIARGEDIQWEVTGFTDYETTGLMESLEEYLKLQEAGIDSASLKREAQKAIAAKAVRHWGMPQDLLSKVEEELEKEPFNLTDSQRDALVRLAQTGQIDQRSLYEVLKAAGDLPESFDINVAIQRLMGETPSKTIPPETVLSNGRPTEPITEPAS